MHFATKRPFGCTLKRAVQKLRSAIQSNNGNVAFVWLNRWTEEREKNLEIEFLKITNDFRSTFKICLACLLPGA